MEGRDQTNKGTTEEKDSTKVPEVKDQATKEPTQQPNITTAQGSCATPMDGETKEDNTAMQDAEGDAEMTPSEVGTEDPDLRDLVEREGIDLPHILEQWKRQGVDTYQQSNSTASNTCSSYGRKPKPEDKNALTGR
jgi:hypothetical protein